jgi:KaiC/GvpD/RAD55 family RecA-like ATPase
MIFSFSLSGEKKIYLVISPPEKLKLYNIEIIRQLIIDKQSVLVVTTNQPYTTLVKNYENCGLDISRIWFVDAITKSALGRIPQEARNCRFVKNPANITDLGIVITDVLNKFPDQKPCILFDSISTMLIYIPSINISKFFHFITNKLRLMNFSGIFLAVEKGLDPDVLTQLTTFVDEVIDLDKNPKIDS